MVFGVIHDVFGIHWVLINTIIVLFLYQCVFKTWSYFEKQNVKFVRGIPLIGSIYQTMLGTDSASTILQKIYNQFSNERLIGMYQTFGCPTYFIRDPELIKQISVKDFEHFSNHSITINEESDPIFGKTMFVMRDERWKEMRSTLTPAFTGNKMRLMFSLMDNVTNNLVNYMKKQTATGPFTVDMSGILRKVANDVIASCAFGVEIDSLVDPENEFFKSGQALAGFEGITGLKFMLYITIPKIANFFKISIFEKKHTDYFTKIIKGNIEYREKHKVVRNDMIDLLMQAQKGTLTATDDKVQDESFATAHSQMVKSTTKIQKWTDADLLAQCLGFFLAGFDTVSSTMGFAIHEITVNPDVQKKIIDEIEAVKKKLDGKPVSYEEIQKMKYLDMVVSETLRRWPNTITADRIVGKSIAIENTDGRKVQLKVNDRISLAMQCIQNDSKYFPNPEKFDPERFSDDRKHEIVGGTYFPFGMGPRSCIASRFALLECKTVIFKLLSNFHLEKSEQTQDPLKLLKGLGALCPEKGFVIQLRSRE